MRSLIKVSGVPTTITLTSMDFLYVQWRIKSTVALTDTTGTTFIGGVNYNWTMRPCYWTADLTGGSNPFTYPSSGTVGSYLGFSSCAAYPTQTLGTVTSGPAGGAISGNATLFSTNTYTAGSKQRKMTYKFNITQGNHASGIGSIVLYTTFSGAGYQISFEAVSGGGTIPKDNTKELTLGFTFSYGR